MVTQQNVQGIAWMILTGFLAVSIYTLVRHLSSDFHAFQLVFFYNALALLFYIPALLRRKIALRTERDYLYVLRATLEFVAFSLSFYALTRMPLPMHTSLSFTSPLFGSIAAVIFLKEPNNIHRWLALAIGFAGVLVVTRPGYDGFNDAAWLILLAAACFSVCGVCIKKLTHTEPSPRIAFFMVLMTAIIALPFAVSVWVMPHIHHLPWLLLLGLLVATVQYTVSQAFSKADMTIILPFFFLNLLWSSLYAYLFFDEIVSEWTVLGGAIILNGALYAAHTVRKTNMRATTMATVGSS